jgi:hypothetical protein
MDNTTTHAWYGGTQPASPWPLDSKTLYAFTLLGKIAAVKVGVDARRTIAIQCISGRNFDKFLFFNGTIELDDRYAGMKCAFGPDKEFLTPERIGLAMQPRRLRRADYENLVLGALEKSIIPSNQWLSANRRHFPILRWLFGQGGALGYFAFTVCTICAFFLIVILTFASWASGSSWKAEMTHAVLFGLLSAYDGSMLDIRREVAYIRVKRSNVGPEVEQTWDALMTGALRGPASSALVAVQDLATGQVRREDEDLAIPVMALKPWVEWNTASWCFMLTNLRAPLLALSSTFLQASHFNWMVAHACVVFAQAILQDKLSRMFLSAAEPREIFWFRRLPNRHYIDEVKGYTWALE